MLKLKKLHRNNNGQNFWMHSSAILKENTDRIKNALFIRSPRLQKPRFFPLNPFQSILTKRYTYPRLKLK